MPKKARFGCVGDSTWPKALTYTLHRVVVALRAFLVASSQSVLVDVLNVVPDGMLYNLRSETLMDETADGYLRLIMHTIAFDMAAGRGNFSR